MKQDIWPGKSWDPGFLVPEEHLSKALYWGTCQVILTLNWHKIDIRYTKWWNFTEHLKLIKSSLQVLCCLIDIVPISSDPLPLSQTFFNDYLRCLGHTQPKWLVCSCLYGLGGEDLFSNFQSIFFLTIYLTNFQDPRNLWKQSLLGWEFVWHQN